jgi:hypothetical protein
MAQFELALPAEEDQEEDAAQQHCVVPGIALSPASRCPRHRIIFGNDIANPSSTTSLTPWCRLVD